ncbi:glutamine--fructose-6-phosphate transaminase (isomerizing) [Candidatus Endowatersipora endosymbiont of Watersipora subatra]|uniref:glutamine--fructose-6-phosphate transaminase (isomerizing) n=1 Tax=Candidatus Endowatersipora endosymbiont of Watersipora subatra TaxID=3077946 RepID=UPI00312C8BBB
MCGIIGIVSARPVSSLILHALKHLEYRGYDSAGIATLQEGSLERRRSEGKLINLEKLLKACPLRGTIGIGHIRWATHGAPITDNAHPHFSEGVAVVHNGIIENFRELRFELEYEGFSFSSQTDTEVIAHLVSSGLKKGLTPKEAAYQALLRLHGAFALALVFEGEDNLMVAGRRGPPLAIGYGEKEMYLGSDAVALAPFTNRITYLDDGDWAIIKSQSAEIFDMHRNLVSRNEQVSLGSSLKVEKGSYRHFMLKEIYEQPEVIGHTLSSYIDFNEERVDLSKENLPPFTHLDRLFITACGTAFLAGLISKYWFERHARLPVEIDIASEFRYRNIPMSPGGLSIFISQSGETADTLASLKFCEEQGQNLAAIVNVKESTIARSSNFVVSTLAGPEISVASTKAFTCQLSVLAILSIIAGVRRGHIDRIREKQFVRELSEIPHLAYEVLKLEHEIVKIAHSLAHKKHVLYLGRDTNYPLALEGALKLKELSYIHAEGYAAGELKHGPIALINEEMPIIVIAPYDHIYEKTVSNMQEVVARGGEIILITNKRGASECGLDLDKKIIMPDMPEIATPIVYSLPVQMLAYHTAVIMGTDIDQPRNLAKSVTVE